MVPITLAQVGEAVSVQRVGGRDAERQKLGELGFVIGARVVIVQKVGGSVIADVKGTRIALNEELARRVFF